MAVAVILEHPGATLDDYERVLAALGLAGTPYGAPGMLFHWAAAVEGGIRVVDVWSDRDVAEAFVRDRLVPAARANGLTGVPDIQVLELHNILRGA